MAVKKRTKIVLTYIITIIFTLALATVICYIAFSSILFGDEEKGNDTQATQVHLEPMTVLDDYAASYSDSRTVLLILDAEKRESGSCFMVARFNPVKEQFVFLPLPSNLGISSDGTADTLYNIFRNGGSNKAVSAVESCLNIKIDNYIRFNRSSFSVIADIFGGVEYVVPYNLVYDNPDTGEATVLKAGRQFLDSTAARKVLTYPNYTQGEEYRAKCLGMLVNDLVATGTVNRESFAKNLDDYFSAVINSDVDTDITSYDYDEVERAMKYVIKNASNLSTFVLSSGVTDENGIYILDEKFLANLPEALMISEEE